MKKLLNTYLGLTHAVLVEDVAKRKDCFRELVSRMFYGEELDVKDSVIYDYLLIPELWDVWQTLDYSKVVKNDNTGVFSSTMAMSFIYGGYFDPDRLNVDKFIDIFEDGAGKSLLTNLTDGLIAVDSESIAWMIKTYKLRAAKIYGDAAKNRKIKIAPIDEEALNSILKLIGKKDAAKYGLNLERLKKRVDYPEIMQKWLKSMDVQILRKVQQALCAEMGHTEYYIEVLYSGAGNMEYRSELFQKLFRMKSPPPVTLGAKVALPEMLTGSDLCNGLNFIVNYVTNTEMVQGVITEDDFKVRTLDILMSQNTDLYECGLTACKLLLRIQGGQNAG